MDKGTVLLIDDDREILEVCSEVLLDAGFEVVSYDNPLEALESLQKGRKVDLIITDFRMPELNGLQLMEKINSLKILVPVVMFTGLADKELAIKALNAGCYSLVEKPMRNQEFIHYAEQAMAYGRLETISERLIQECTNLIKLLKDLSGVYETRFTHAENAVYQGRAGQAIKAEDIQGYLRNISQGISVENAVAEANKAVEALVKEHRNLKQAVHRSA